MVTSKQIKQTTEKYGAHNYNPLPNVIEEAKEIWNKILENK